jgi:3-phosphoglycerate kinase
LRCYTELLPSFAGLLMQKECAALRALTHPRRPFLAVIAGSKLDTKIGRGLHSFTLELNLSTFGIH